MARVRQTTAYLIKHSTDPRGTFSQNISDLGWFFGLAVTDNQYPLVAHDQFTQVQLGGLRQVQDYLASGFDPNFSVQMIDNEMWTPLMVADGSVVDLLVKAGGNINYQSPVNGNTPLIVATFNNRLATVIALLKDGADKTLKDKAGHTALDIAITKNNQDLVKILSASSN